MMPAGGDVKMNINRWKGQFSNGDADKIKAEEMTIGAWTVHIADVNGNYTETMGGGPFSGGKKVKRTDYAMVGGILVDTPLEGMDGRTYAVAGGPVNLSGFSASGAGGGVSKNHDTSGKVEAQIEVEMDTEPAFPTDKYRLLLLNKDYATAHRIANEINRYFPGSAWAGDPSRVEVTFPQSMMHDKLGFVTKIGSFTVAPDEPARVVINQKTGTIVVGQNVKLSRVVFANENLVITTNETPIASQPAPFSDGQTAILPRTQLTATETGGTYNQLSHNSTVGDLANILNTLGVRPRDLINIFHDLRASGALQAQLILE
jgi:flagellar P-ring protein precursor FlgI